MDTLTHKNNVIEAMVQALKIETEELKRKFILCKTTMCNWVLVVTPKHNIDVLKPKKFKWSRTARDIDNFL
ncbi:hypothetical protein Goshw_024333 [Gossypium schwendimanii]|uniref:Uncharacterized protein n=1 Tax=Gossypium schwendimanii TaxID=34291 RepID=A0A7J9MYV1_GOSSC|nr:hypothetical protein [Gossypium schwendimanii]